MGPLLASGSLLRWSDRSHHTEVGANPLASPRPTYQHQPPGRLDSSSNSWSSWLDCHFCLQKWQAKSNSLFLLTLTLTVFYFSLELREGVEKLEEGRTNKLKSTPLTADRRDPLECWTRPRKTKKKMQKYNHKSSSRISLKIIRNFINHNRKPIKIIL